MITEGTHVAAILAQTGELPSGGIHPPHTIVRCTGLAEVNAHIAPRIVVHHQITVATRCSQTVVTRTVVEHYALVGHTAEIRHGEHELLKIAHLVEARVVECLVPRLALAVGKI